MAKSIEVRFYKIRCRRLTHLGVAFGTFLWNDVYPIFGINVFSIN